MLTRRHMNLGTNAARKIQIDALLSLILALAAACAARPGASPTPAPAAPAASTGLLSAPPLVADLRFQQLSLDQGLSQSVALELLQDPQGFLWIATQDGLNRYDGYQFKIYKHDPENPNSLTDNFIPAMEIDPDGVIWIGTNAGGLNRYDPKTGQFTHYLNDPDDPTSLGGNSVQAVLVGSDGSIWAGTGSAGLNRLDPASGTFTRYLYDPNDPASLSSNTIFALAEDRQGGIWAGTFDGGLNRLDPASGRFTRYQNDPDDPTSLSDNGIQSLYIDRQGDLWVGTITGGLNRFNPASGTFTRYRYDPADPASLGSDWVLSMGEDQWGRFWIGTNGGGVNLMDRETGEFTRFQNNPSNPTSLPNNYIWDVFEDRSGMLWFGTFGGGLAAYDPYKYKFQLLQAEPGNPESLSSNLVWEVYQDRQGVFWFGTNGGGLDRYDPLSGEWEHYRFDPADPNSLADDIVYTVYQDRQGDLWIGTNSGVSRIDSQTGQMTTYETPAQVLGFYEDRHGDFWLAGLDGLYRLDRTDGSYERFNYNPSDPQSLSSDAIIAINEDASGALWIGTSTGGLNRFERHSGGFTRFRHDPDDPASLSQDTVLTIFPQPDGTLWIGTAGGLYHFDPASGRGRTYRVKDGLPDNYIYMILQDDSGDLWVSTNRGLGRLSLNPDGSVRLARRYDKTDGLQGYEFNQGAAFAAQDGVFYFGGVNGISYFRPEQVQDNPFVPPVVLTEMKVFNKPVQPGEDAPLQQPVEFARQARLPYTDDFFELDYAALHFSSPQENRYAYILEPLEKEWNEVGDRRFASYTNVPPGEYTFRVKGSNSDGVWNEAGASLAISIPPPFWQTTWFRLLAALGLLGGISAVFMLRIRSVEAQRRRLEEQVEQRTQELRQAMGELETAKEAAEAASRAKSAFLANMSHEFRTPLNAILGFTQIMIRDRRLPSEQRENIEIIHRSSEHLLGLINDVLEMSKIEAGRTSLNWRSFDLQRMLEGLEEMFALRAEDKGIALKLDMAADTPQYVRGDEGKLRQVLMNLLGNAVKFTSQGVVSLRARRASAPVEGHAPAGLAGEALAWVRLEVEDSGVGISPADLQKLFEPFVQTKSGLTSAQEGTGLGLPISQEFVRLMGGQIEVRSQPEQPGKTGGSTFAFTIPLDEVSASDLERPPVTRRVVGVAAGQPELRMLVVDDKEVNRKLLIKLFAPLGFALREAVDGQQAIEAWQVWQPHLIWMDMRMPVMDGYEATRRIKATTSGMATIIVALTASALEEDRVVILSEGCDDYLRKPFHEQELYDMVAKHLGVQFIYEELLPGAEDLETGRPAGAARSAEVDAALVDSLSQIEAGWLDGLERAALLGDLDALAAEIGRLAELDTALAASLADLAARFDHERILALIAAARQEKPTSPQESDGNDSK